MAIFRPLSFLFLLGLAGCVGHSGTSLSSDRWPYREDLVNRTRDQILLEYGTPTRSSFTSGGEFLEYDVKKHVVFDDRNDRQRCTVKMLLQKNRVTDADAHGDWHTCDWLIQSGQREFYADLREKKRRKK
jgi:hypothetical protein